MAKEKDMDFNDLAAWLRGVDPENRSDDDHVRQAARLVISSQGNPFLVAQALQILGGS